MRWAFLISLVAAAVAPLLTPSPPRRAADDANFPGWPENYLTGELVPLGLDATERRFMENFPGRTERFRAGDSTIIIRWVPEATRHLHSATLCYRGGGWSIKDRPIHVDGQGRRWGQYLVTKGDERIRVLQRIENDQGDSWLDESSWYWAAAMNRTTGPLLGLDRRDSPALRSSLVGKSPDRRIHIAGVPAGA